MEKSSSSSNGSRELQCVGTMEIVKPKPVGFLCGSIPVPTDKSFHVFKSALVPSAQTVRAPRYRVLPNETDLNRPPFISSNPEKVLPVAVAQSRTNGDLPWENDVVSSNLTRRGEALAVCGFVEYGDELDVIAPAHIMKQIFKIPYSKARLSIAVHRVGETLVLNTGPEVEDGEKTARRHNNHSKNADQSLFSNFAMHSVRMEACDCPPACHPTSQEPSKSSEVPGEFEVQDFSFKSGRQPAEGNASQFFQQSDNISSDEEFNSKYPQVKKDTYLWGSKNNKKNKAHHAVKKSSHVKEKPRRSMQESDKYRGLGKEGFLRVLFWQFHNFRMLLGSDLLLFSNDKYAAVSLHLWDVSRQVTPLTWLEAWLDNVMASVPELAICYHQDGVVQGYELLKTDDIFLSKGISEDGAPAFHPHVVQQNGLSVLRFLQDNCKQDPGAYWLYKSAGEDVIQLFDLSVIPQTHSSSDSHSSSPSLPSLIHKGRTDSLLSLGTILYRVAHRLSLSMSPHNRARCARFFKKCLVCLDEPDHLVVRALAHEQFARFLLSYDEELDLVHEAVPVESAVTLPDGPEEESFDLLSNDSESIVRDMVYSPLSENEPCQDSGSEQSVEVTLGADLPSSETLITSGEKELIHPGAKPSLGDENMSVTEIPKSSAHEFQTSADSISSKLAAVHHISQAIKSLRWKRQQHSSDSESEFDDDSVTEQGLSSSIDFSVCACGDVDCIEVCDIRKWLPSSKLDDKLWKLILLLGESYLALGQSYKDDGQLFKALKIVELAALVYGSMPQHLEDTRFISSMVCSLPHQMDINNRSNRTESYISKAGKGNTNSSNDHFISEQCSSMYLFWAKAWTLVGDVYVDFHTINGVENCSDSQTKPCTNELRMSTEVLKEVKRLKEKLGQFNQNCSFCSLINCSCQSDRVSSGSCASSSTADTGQSLYGRKKNRRSYLKSRPSNQSDNLESNHVGQKEEYAKSLKSRCLMDSIKINTAEAASNTNENMKGEFAFADAGSERVQSSDEVHKSGSSFPTQSESDSREASNVKNGGIFKYLENPVNGDAEYNLLAALGCYEEASKSLSAHACGSAEKQSIVRKRGWVCNELGRKRLERKELSEAELAFAEAINSFREVADHTNVILIFCNLGHGRRAIAEEMVTKAGSLRKHAIFRNAYNQALLSAKLEYTESLRYYGAAKMELNAIVDETDSGFASLRNEVYTQIAHTYLRLGMFLAREDMVAQVSENGVSENFMGSGSGRAKKDLSKHEVSANDAIREALSVYESLGELRKQEAAFAYFQLACYQRDCSLKFFESEQKKKNNSRGEKSSLQRMKQYASLADRNWQKSLDFYGPKTHPTMYLTILAERSDLSIRLSGLVNSNAMLESALGYLLQGRHVGEEKDSDSSGIAASSDACGKFRRQLQMLLKKMLGLALSATTTSKSSQQSTTMRSFDVNKLRELYKMSLKSSELGQLQAMHDLWTSAVS